MSHALLERLVLYSWWAFEAFDIPDTAMKVALQMCSEDYFAKYENGATALYRKKKYS